MLGLLLRRRRRAAMLNASRRVGRAADERLKIAGPIRPQLDKVFPEHWSFMLGEIALYSFIVLILSGTYLTFFYDPSENRVLYHGSYTPLRDVSMSKAFESTMNISFDVRAGLLIRQVHHWAALLFMAAVILHMCRIFFTGAFRKPRELNWLIGLAMTGIAMVEGYCGYALPDDQLSGEGLRIASAVLLSIPVIGTWLQFLIFGGEFPGHHILERLYITHVLLFPGLIIALLAAHLTMIVRQKHTDFAGHGRTEKTVAGERLYLKYAFNSIGLFFCVLGVLFGLGGFAQINPIFYFGPFEPSVVSSNSQPDFFVWFLDGSLRVFPPWEIRAFHHTVPNVFWAGVVLPMALFAIAAAYPWIEARLFGDREKHNVLERPRDNPRRTAIGAMALSFWIVLSLAATQDVLSHVFEWSLDWVLIGMRTLLFVVPPIAYLLARHICVRLQEHDRRLVDSGIGTGLLQEVPDGGWAEVTVPVESISSGEPEGAPYETRPSSAPVSSNR